MPASPIKPESESWGKQSIILENTRWQLQILIQHVQNSHKLFSFILKKEIHELILQVFDSVYLQISFI